MNTALNDPEQTGGAPAQPEVGIAEPAAAAAPAPAAIPAALAAEGIPTRFACFVAGTDTEIGKTLVSSAILHKLVDQGVRACGMKPIAAGAELRDGELHNEDAAMLRGAGNVHLPQHITTPFMLREPCAPHIAAALEGVTIEPVPIIAAYAEILGASDATVVEGVGGFCVPFSDDFDSAGLAVQLGLPVILVVGLRLGCISHALLTAEAIVARGLVLAGWVANLADPDMRFVDENVAALQQRMPAPLLGRIPRLDQPTAAAAAAFIELAGLPGWPARQH
ncbi:dethiobiotin synthase [Massilia forsythiae]|uniref:ATP-dependent dethiobiotin synthetase BioD n=1 Tax=Massilia forsythiae TaxID=2728020 RepID=A0A7Z2ZSC7_9BURK|nr:dethiobiotin synthase [Massilia forsythiae]QJE00070.1 dethiobiotin synthase [Massilia forsythiae]